MQKYILFAAVAACVTTAPAAAEEAHDWSGPYVGVGAGHHVYKEPTDGETVTVKGADIDIAAGFNFQLAKNIVMGFEASHGFSSGRYNIVFPHSSTVSEELTYDITGLSMVRTRLGVAFGRTLAYGTVGVSRLGIRTTAILKNGSAVGADSDQGSHHGVVFGLGAEQAISERMSVRGEWLHVNLRSRPYSHDLSGSNLVGVVSSELEGKSNAFRVAAAYRF